MGKYILLFDFGHGTPQYTKGKRSPDETLFEGEWNREVGNMIVQEMKTLGVDCRIIVKEDQDISLQERCDRANKIIKSNPKKNCRYISIHIDAAAGNGWSTASGMSVYVSKNASNESIKLARCFYDTIEEFGLTGNRYAPAERVWRANYKVLTGTSCPAVLIEDLFMTNRKDCEFLKSKHGKETIVNLYVVALCKYIGIPYAFCQG